MKYRIVEITEWPEKDDPMEVGTENCTVELECGHHIQADINGMQEQIDCEYLYTCPVCLTIFTNPALLHITHPHPSRGNEPLDAIHIS